MPALGSAMRLIQSRTMQMFHAGATNSVRDNIDSINGLVSTMISLPKTLGLITLISALALGFLYAPELPLVASVLLAGNVSEAVRTPYFLAVPLVAAALWSLVKATKPLPTAMTAFMFMFILAFTIIRGFIFSLGSFPPLHVIYPLGLVTIGISAIGLASSGLSFNLLAHVEVKATKK